MPDVLIELPEPGTSVLPGEFPGVTTIGPFGAPEAFLVGPPLLDIAPDGIDVAEPDVTGAVLPGD